MGRCPFHLVRRENREPDPFGREDIERLGVDRRFGQPHPGGLTPKAAPEVAIPHRTSVTLSRREARGRMA